MAWTSTDTLNLLRTLAPYANQLERIDEDAKKLRERMAVIIARHSAYGALDSVESVESSTDLALDGYRAAARAITEQCRRIIQDRDLVVSKLPIPIDSGYTDIVRALVPAMGNIDLGYDLSIRGLGTTAGFDGDSILGAGPTIDAELEFRTIGAIYPGTSDTERQSLTPVFTLFQDGVSAPTSGSISVKTNVGRASQSMIEDETFTIEVTQDAQSGGRLPGQELLRIYSNNQGSGYDGLPGGSGSVNNLVTAHVAGEALTSVASLFPAFVSDVPNGWTVVTGTAGTSFSEDDTNLFRGASSLAVPADATFELTRDVAAASIVRNQLYFLYWWYKSSVAAVDGPPVVEVHPTDASLTPLSPTGVLTPSGNTAGRWRLGVKLYQALEVQPAAITKLRIVGDGSNEACSLASVGLTPVAYYGGLGYAFIPGAFDPLAGSRYQLSSEALVHTYVDGANTYTAGGWVRFFNKGLGIPIQIVPPAAFDETVNPPYDQVLYSNVVAGEDLDTVE